MFNYQISQLFAIIRIYEMNGITFEEYVEGVIDGRVAILTFHTPGEAEFFTENILIVADMGNPKGGLYQVKEFLV